MLDEQLVDAAGAVATFGGGFGVEVLECRSVRQQIGVRLARCQCRDAQVRHSRCSEGFLHVGIGAECSGALLQQ